MTANAEQPTFGYSTAARDGLQPGTTAADRKVNLRARGDVSSPVVAVVSAATVVYAGNAENGMRPVRVEGWISEELVTV